MFRFNFKVLIAISSMLLIVGCGSSSNSTVQKRPSLNENGIVSTAVGEVKLDESVVSDGVAIDDIVVTATKKDGTKVVETVIPAGTEFIDDKGEIVDTQPVVSIVQKESKEEVVEDGKNIIKNVVKTELKLVDSEGKKIIPSEPVEISVKAPEGTKPGDKVTIDMPDGADLDKRVDNEKLIVVVVASDGNVHVLVAPQVFKNMTVVIIIIEKLIEKPITGGAGGN